MVFKKIQAVFFLFCGNKQLKEKKKKEKKAEQEEEEEEKKAVVTVLPSSFKKNQILLVPDLRNSLMNETKQQTDKQKTTFRFCMSCWSQFNR